MSENRHFRWLKSKQSREHMETVSSKKIFYTKIIASKLNLNRIFDELNVYLQIDKATISRMDSLARAHWEMTIGNWIDAKNRLLSQENGIGNELDLLIVNFFLEELVVRKCF